MYKSILIKIIIFINLFMLSTFAYAEFDKKCFLENILYVSPSLAGCVFSGSSTSKIFFKLNNLDVNVDKCLSRLDLSDENLQKFKNDILNIEKELSINDKNLKPILLIKINNEGYSGTLLNNRILGVSSFEIPFIKKDFEGIANVYLDNGLTINLKVNEIAKLKLIGGFGKISMQGKCEVFTR